MLGGSVMYVSIESFSMNEVVITALLPSHAQEQATSNFHLPKHPSLHRSDANGQAGQDCQEGGTPVRVV